MVASCPKKILIVEDDEDVRIVFKMILTRFGMAVETASGVVEARALMKKKKFDVVVTDFCLRDGNAVDIARGCGDSYVLVISGRTDIATVFPGFFNGIVTKPVDLDRLGSIVDSCEF